MKAPIEDQHRLVALQELDTQLAKVAHKRKNLPEHAELAQLVASKDGIDARLVAAETRVADAELARQRAEDDLAPVRERKLRDQQLIDAGGNGDAKALQSLIAEVEHLTRRIGTLEDAELEAMEELEIATSLRDDIARERENFMPSVRKVKDRREQLMADCDAEAAELTTKRQAAAALVAPELLDLYGKVAARSGGLAVAKLVQHKCSGCGMEADVAAQQKYASAPVEEIVRCEECNRILIRG